MRNLSSDKDMEAISSILTADSQEEREAMVEHHQLKIPLRTLRPEDAQSVRRNLSNLIERCSDWFLCRCEHCKKMKYIHCANWQAIHAANRRLQQICKQARNNIQRARQAIQVTGPSAGDQA